MTHNANKWGRLGAALILTTILAGCGGGGNGSGGGNSGFAPPVTQGGATLRANVAVLPSDGSVKITNATAAGGPVTLTGNVPDIKAGSVIVSNATLPDGSYGLIRKVKSVSKSGGTTTLQTERGDLGDIFSEAHVKNAVAPSNAELAKVKPALPGVTFTVGGGAASKAVGGRAPHGTTDLGALNVAMKNVLIQADDANGTVIGKINGNLNINLKFISELDIDHFLLYPTGIKHFLVAPALTVHADAALSSTAKGHFSKRIAISQPAEFSFGLFGPLQLKTSLTFYVTLEGDLDGDATISVSGDATLSAGVQCNNNVFSFYNPSNYKFAVSKPGYYPHAQAKVFVGPVQPEFNVSVPGLGGLYARGDLMKGDITIAYGYNKTVKKNGFFYLVEGEFQGTVGGKIQLLNFVNYGESYTTNFPKFQISNTFVPDTGQVTPVSGGGSGGIGIIFN